MADWELIIIGGGPAGLAAGIYGVRSGLKTLVLEEKIAGGTAVDAPIIENYPGFPSISGFDLAQKMVDHAKNLGISIHEFEAVTKLDFKGQEKIVTTDKGAYSATALIIASGSHYRELGVPGEKEYRGRGVSYCGLCDGPLFKNKRILVVGGGNSALITTLYLAGLAAEVQIAHRRDSFRAEEALVRAIEKKDNVKILWNTEIREIKGEKLVNKAVLLNSKTQITQELQVDGVFVQVGEDPNSQLAKEASVAVDEDSYIIVDMLQKTSVPGVYAAGDVTSHPVKQVGTAVGQGITAATQAYGYIRR
ncbi:thioredoxin-disulfide reductase, partial [Candidatus Bathyarchaeota archaeon]|nr:thioredoxin-disulfide reductase [Candidatus Bathyarchaeota archaeon]